MLLLAKHWKPKSPRAPATMKEVALEAATMLRKELLIPVVRLPVLQIRDPSTSKDPYISVAYGYKVNITRLSLSDYTAEHLAPAVKELARSIEDEARLAWDRGELVLGVILKKPTKDSLDDTCGAAVHKGIAIRACVRDRPWGRMVRLDILFRVVSVV